MRIGVIGAGASGLMVAGNLARRGFEVTVFEKREKVARKILITGKGRCNILNNCEKDDFLKNVPRNHRFLYSAIDCFTPHDTMDFFENEVGISLKTERGNRVFPKSEKAMDVVDKMLAFCEKEGVKFIFNTVCDVFSDDNEQIAGIVTQSKKYHFDAVVVATGGLSYPKTGSSGDGYRFAKKFSHTIIEPEASLVALKSDTQDIASLQGLSLKNVEVTLFDGNKPIFKDFGEMLFTHFGVSGPLILSSSAHIISKNPHKISIDLKPSLDEKTLDKRILRDFEKNINKNFNNSLDELLPKKLIPVVINRSGISEFAKVNVITKKERQNLCKIIKNFEVSISEKCSVDEAVITRGGVCVKEINPKTMESKKIKGLYFIGEVLDVDAYTGGFNLQIAWSTAYLMANSL
ncbi:MAG: NAD(P)/FAD-dependent oxidoreductase [Clostridia bacterium]